MSAPSSSSRASWRRWPVAATAIVALAAIAVFVLVVAVGTDHGAAVSPDPVTVSPSPGAGTASPETQVSLRGLPASRLSDIEVSGSETGAHAGRLQEHSDGNGASFVPHEPFEPGEEVTVRTGQTVLGAKDGEFGFTVARPAAEPGPKQENRPGGRIQRFRSRPDLRPPVVTVTARSGDSSRGHLFVAPKRGNGLDGPMIVDSRGKLVWARELPAPKQAADFRVQRFRGRPVLTWWEGVTNVGVGFGEGVVLDQSYRELMRVRAGNGHRAGLHEFLLTPRGTALFVIYSFVERDLSGVGGPKDGVVIDNVVQEVELETGLVRLEWHSLDDVSLEESQRPVPKEAGAAYDYAHVNSVGVDTDDDLLVSARHTWAIYKIDRRTGTVRWRLGGKKSDFELRPGARFAFQHDARRHEDGTLTLFDNAAGPPETREASRALALELDMDEMTARVAREHEHPRGLLSESQGNAQNLPNGNVLVGWGSQPVLSEYTEDGRLVYDARLAKGNDNYRAYRGRWEGRPDTKPNVAATRAGDGRLRVFASWNGATEVARWQALAGARPDALRRVAAAAKRGFETPIAVPPGAAYLAVRARDADGRALGTSEPIPAPR